MARSGSAVWSWQWCSHETTRIFIGLAGRAMAWPVVARARGAKALSHLVGLYGVPSRSVSGRFSPRGARAGICRGRERCFRNALCTWKSLALRQVISELRRGNINLAVSSGPATRAMTTVTTFPPPTEFCVHGPRANLKGFLRLSLVTCRIALYPATSEAEKISFNQVNKDTERS